MHAHPGNSCLIDVPLWRPYADITMIETQDLSKQFNDFWAVDGVTLSVKPGQILALLGQNGAGKTTTVRMLTALLGSDARNRTCCRL